MPPLSSSRRSVITPDQSREISTFRPAAVYRIFNRAEVIKRLSVSGEIAASADHFLLAVDSKNSEQGMLCGDAEYIKDAASDMLTDTTVGI